MTQMPPGDDAADREARELADLQSRTEEARAALSEVQRNLAQALNQLGDGEVDRLREANENLIFAALQSRTDAEATARAMLNVARAAELDPLTQLPNRVLLLDRFEQAIANARRSNKQIALLFVDLNRFKQINDTLGHAVGDEVLQLAARCMVASVRASDTVSRHGGDEFLILLDDISQASDAAAVADKVIAALGTPALINDHVMRLTASIGISLYPSDGEYAGELIALADGAMYRAKREGVCSFVFHDALAMIEPLLQTPVLGSLQAPLSHFESSRQAFQLRHQQLQEANEQLLLSALGARELQVAAEEALKRQTQSMAKAAHELRNPLMSIQSASTVIERSAGDQPLLPRMTAVIERQVAQMSRLVNDLLDVSRVSTGTLRIERREVEMTRLIDEVVEACRPAMDTRLQHFKVQAHLGELPVYGDPLRLSQVLRNLLDNASKYTPRGGDIKLSVVRLGDSLLMTVTDSGIGIGTHALAHIFDPFVQDADATAFDGSGLGLGLTVVRELVQAHGGQVEAYSAGPGCGSQFRVTLPLVETKALPGSI
ncbi:MAG: diguanylate cyclase [Burkholderiaceae bacterium]|nr:diguanylate cyclase [Burkholderiaceae bacterium]